MFSAIILQMGTIFSDVMLAFLVKEVLPRIGSMLKGKKNSPRRAYFFL